MLGLLKENRKDLVRLGIWVFKQNYQHKQHQKQANPKMTNEEPMVNILMIGYDTNDDYRLGQGVSITSGIKHWSEARELAKINLQKYAAVEMYDWQENEREVKFRIE